MLRKKIGAGIAALAVAASGIAFAPAASAAEKVLSWGSAVDVTGYFDPYAVSDGHYRPIMNAAYEPLIRNSYDLKKFTPGLATKWVWKNNKTLVLTLRKGVKFTDGAVFDAAAVKANLDRVVVDKFPGPRSGAIRSVQSVTVVNPSTVQLNLAYPDSNLILGLSRNMGWMVSPKAIASKDSKGQLPALATATAGAGMYMLDWTQSVKASKYTFVKNPNYYNKSEQKFDKLVFYFLTDPKARLNALRTGQVDIAPLDVLDAPTAQSAGLTIAPTALDIMNLRITDRNGETVKALGNVKVRQAMNYAINRNQFAAFGLPTTQSYPQGIAAYNKKWDNYYKYDLEKAKQLMKEAGYADGFDMTVVSPSNAGSFGAAAAITQADLKKIGINLKIVVAAATFVTEIGKKTNQGFFLPYGTSSVSDVVNDLYGPGKVQWNQLEQTDPELLKLKDQYLAIGDQASKPAVALAQKIGERIVTQALDVFLYNATSYLGYNAKTVKNVRYTVGNIVPNIYGISPK